MDHVIKNVLLTISDIDSKLTINKKEKNKLVKNYEKKTKICNMFNKLLSYKVNLPLVLILSIINYVNYSNKIISIFLTLSIISVFNFIIVFIIKCFEPKSKVFEDIQKYAQEKQELLSKRKTYINIYNYLTSGDKAIFNNIKLRVNNNVFYNYDDYVKELWIQDDTFALNKILEMKEKEQKLVNNIKNTIYCEINSPEKKEGLTIEQLMIIDEAL